MPRSKNAQTKETQGIEPATPSRGAQRSSSSSSSSSSSPFFPHLAVCACVCVPERIFEDHENLVENLLNWTRDSHNKLMFIERIEKYALFKNPQVGAPRLSNPPSQ